MKVLIAGESNIHLQNYCKAIRPYVQSMAVLTETPLEVPQADAQFLIGFRSRNPFSWLIGLFRLQRLIVSSRPDIIHLHQVNRLAYFVTRVAARFRIPVVTTAWGSDVLLVPERNAVYRGLVKKVLLSSKVVTADAQVMIDAMIQLVDVPSKYVLLQYGIDPVTPAPKEKIIYSNRLHRPLYNIETILRDFAGFVREHAEWRLVVGATGPETDRLKELADELKVAAHVDFVGWLDKARNEAFYARATIYVSIPSSDGTSVSLLEAMSADCIPVVSDIPVSKEWVADGINGIVRKAGVNPFSAALLIDRERCLAHNRRLISEKVDRKSTTAEFFRIYQNVLASR